MLEYKGYYALAEYDKESATYHVNVINSMEEIIFKSKSLKEAEEKFHSIIDKYTLVCRVEGVNPKCNLPIPLKFD